MAPGVRMTVWSQVTDVDPDRRLEETFVSSWTHGTLEYTVSATGDGTLLRQPETLTPKGPLRLLDCPIAAMLRPALVKRLEETRDLLEAADGPGTNVRRTDGEAGLQAIGVAERPELAPCDRPGRLHRIVGNVLVAPRDNVGDPRHVAVVGRHDPRERDGIAGVTGSAHAGTADRRSRSRPLRRVRADRGRVRRPQPQVGGLPLSARARRDRALRAGQVAVRFGAARPRRGVVAAGLPGRHRAGAIEDPVELVEVRVAIRAPGTKLERARPPALGFQQPDC